MQIEHIAIWSQRLEELRAFYETYFGARAGAKYSNAKGFQSYFLSFDGGARLELMQRADIPLNANDVQRQATGLIHLAFQLGSAQRVDELTARLANDGFSVLSLPRTTGDGYYESCVLDPDGNRIEITV